MLNVVLFRDKFGNGLEFEDNLSYPTIKEIELTIEWLSVFDFEEVERGYFLDKKAPIHLIVHHNYETGKFYAPVLNFIEIKTVNQLQEIFLALMNFKLLKK